MLPPYPAPERAAPRGLTRPGVREALGVAGVAGGLYVLVAVLQWRRYEVPSWDLAIFTQLVKAYAHLEAPVVPIKGPGFNLLGDHFHPILVLLAPVYRLFPSGLTLLVVQAVLLGVSAWPLTRLAVERLGRRPGLVVGIAYAVSFGLQGAVRSQFHEIAFAVPLLAFGLVALLRGRSVAAACWLAPLVLVKEDLGLTVAVLGAVLAWRGWRGWRGDDAAVPAGEQRTARVAGLALAVWGLLAFIVTTRLVLPALNPRGRWDYTERLTEGGGLGGLLGDPLGALTELLGPGEKVVTLLLLVAVAGVVGLRSPVMLATVPTILWRFAGDVPFYWSWLWHYDAVLMPIATAALLDVLSSRTTRQTAPEPAVPRRDRRLALALSSTLAAVVLTAPGLPLLGLLDANTWREPDRADAAADIVAAVPPGAAVSSDLGLLAYLVPTTTVLWSGTADNPVPDYVVHDLGSGAWGDEPPADAVGWAEETFPGERFELVLSADGYELARRLG